MELEGIVLIFLSVQETTIPNRSQSELCYYVTYLELWPI